MTWKSTPRVTPFKMELFPVEMVSYYRDKKEIQSFSQSQNYYVLWIYKKNETIKRKLCPQPTNKLQRQNSSNRSHHTLAINCCVVTSLICVMSLVFVFSSVCMFPFVYVSTFLRSVHARRKQSHFAFSIMLYLVMAMLSASVLWVGDGVGMLNCCILVINVLEAQSETVSSADYWLWKWVASEFNKGNRRIFFYDFFFYSQ